MGEKLYRYHFMVFLSAKRPLNEEERRSLEALLKDLMEKMGFEMKKITVRRETVFLDFIGNEETDAEKVIRAGEKAFGSGIWSDFRIRKTLVIDGKTLMR